MKKLFLLFGTFVVFTLINLCLPLMVTAATETGISRLLDPLYVASSLATLMFGLVCWSLGRNLNTIDAKLDEHGEKLDEIDKRMNTACILYQGLKSEHDLICKKGGHK